MASTTQRIVAEQPFKFIDDAFRDYNPEYDPARARLPFEYLCVVCGRADSPGPRSSRWECILDCGSHLYQDILDEKPIGAGPHYFIFPDRWLVPAEAQAFLSHLKRNPDAAKFKRVIVVTHQPYLVGDCSKESVRILTETPGDGP